MNEKIKKILMIASSSPRWEGDTESTFILETAKNISKRNKNLEIVILSPHHKGAKREEILNGIKIYRFKYALTSLEKLCYNGGILANIKRNKIIALLIPFFILGELYGIKRIVKKEKIDIIHAHWIILQGLISVIYKKLFNRKIKILCTAHGTDILGLKGIIYETIKKYALKNTDSITAVSKALADEINKYPYSKNKALVIPNAVDTKIFQPSIKTFSVKEKYGINSACLLFVGRLIKEKGIKNLIKALPEILLTFPGTKLLVIGRGHQFSDLKKTVEKLNLKNNVIFLGGIENHKLPIFYSAADIFIGPSVSEGFGVVFIEAMACQTAVISTKVGGVPEIIKDGITGVLIPDNSPKNIAQLAIKLLKNDDLRKKIAKKGREFVIDNFNWKIISAKYSDQYYKLFKK